MTRQQEAAASTDLSTADLVPDEPARKDIPSESAEPAIDVTPDHDVTGDRVAPDLDVHLMDDDDSNEFPQRWSDVQSRFVDDPRAAVHEADTLVAEVMQSLARGFAEHKAALEEQWSHDDQPDTEQLRQALQRYRSFFSRLLAT